MSRHEFAVNLVCKQRIQGGETVTFELYLHVKGMIALSYINHPAGIESRSSSLRLDLDRSRICAFYEIYDCATLKVSTNWHTPKGAFQVLMMVLVPVLYATLYNLKAPKPA